MGWFDDIFGGNPTPPAASAAPGTPPAAPPQPDQGSLFTRLAAAMPGGSSTATPPAQPPANYNDFLNAQVAAAQAREKAAPSSGWSWLSGSGRDAAAAAATAGAPAAWDAQQQGHTATQQGQIGLLQNLAAASAITGRPVDPNNIMGSAPAMGAYGAGVGGQPQPQGQPAPQPVQSPQPPPQAPQPAPQGQPQPSPAPMVPPVPGAPQMPSGAPQAQPGSIFPRLAAASGNLPPVSSLPPTSPQPGLPSTPSGAGSPPMPALQAQPGAPDPQQAWRANTIRMGRIMLMNPQTAAAGEDMIKQASVGLPAGASVLPDGSVAPVRMANGMTAQQYDAQGAGATAGAQANAGIGAANAEAAYKGRVDMGVHAANADVDTAHQVVSVEGPDRKMHSVLRGQLPAGTAPITGSDDNPYLPAQIKEQQDAQTAGSEAATQQNTVQMLGRSLAASPWTGTGARTGLSIMKAADAVGLLGPDGQKALANGEFSNMGAVTVAGILAKQISGGRTPLGIFNQVAASKPGLMTAHPELMIAALNQDLQRAQDKAQFTTNYYSQNGNATKLDAQSAFDKAYPIGMYQSRVLPLPPTAAPTDMQAGYTYQTTQGPAVWTGTGYKRAQ
jgi:hypothetical protein